MHQRRRCDNRSRSQSDAGPRVQGDLLESRKCQVNTLSPEHPEGTERCQHLYLSPVGSIWGFLPPEVEDNKFLLL